MFNFLEMASGSSYCTALIDVWKGNVKKARILTGLLRDELYSVSDLYDELASCSADLFKFNYANDEEIVFKAGEVQEDCDRTLRNAEVKRVRNEHEQKLAEVQTRIDEIVTNRLKLLASEITSLRRLRGKPIGRKRKSRLACSRDASLMEIRRIIKNYERLSLRRYELYKKQVITKIERFRRQQEESELLTEKMRKRSSLHNFSAFKIQDAYESILEKSGGYVPATDDHPKSFLSYVKQFKHHAEAALLQYVLRVTGQRLKNNYKTNVSTKRRNQRVSVSSLRSQVRYNLSHPRLSRQDRNFVYTSLRAIDRFFIKYVKCGDQIFSGRFTGERLLVDQLGKFLKGLPVVLRESDKNLGWSLNSVDWYREEYKRQLASSSYKWVGKLDLIESLKKGCRSELKALVLKYKDFLSISDYKFFNLEGVRYYILPSLNLLPKVHKLSEEASVNIEGLLRGRPITTGHSWCIIEASKFIQRELRDVISEFRSYLAKTGRRDTFLGSSGELVNILGKRTFKFWGANTLVTFDFKDLYTNILFEDASRTLRSLVKILKLDNRRISFILELYQFCNQWNYFNVGDDVFKQVEGLSMGCYFSKEISDLVLMYSEYQYSLISVGRGIRFLKRYADDGIMIFDSASYDNVVREISALMLFYPNNLVINVKLNKVYCQYLDLSLSIDDVTAEGGRVHYKTFFKKFHKFSYLDPRSNHPKHVFRGLVRTECIRYIRNSSCMYPGRRAHGP